MLSSLLSFKSSKSRIPTRSQAEHIAEADAYSAHNYKPIPVVMSRGKGVYVWDTDGKRYLDCLGAYSAVNQGHCHPRIVSAMKEQCERLTISSRAFHNDQMGPFLKKLCEASKMETALLMNSGAEAVETAIKLARKWGYEKKGVAADQAEIIVCENNFHGRTTTIVGFSSEPQYREGFGPFTPGFKIVPYGSVEAIERAITPNTVAFLYEPIQGEGGVIVPPDGFLSAAAALCRKHRVLLLDDEIQTGLGRTGKFFCHEHEPAAKPDVLIVGKALGGGLYPVSAVITSKEIMSVFRPGDHGSTFGGNPLAAAVGIASLEVLLEEGLPERSQELGEYFRAELRKKLTSPAIKEIRGKGLMTGIEIHPQFGKGRAFCEKLMLQGFLVKDTHAQTLRVTPPLIINREELDSIVQALVSVFPTR